MVFIFPETNLRKLSKCSQPLSNMNKYLLHARQQAGHNMLLPSELYSPVSQQPEEQFLGQCML
jgi:hypothetical protein